LGLGSDPDAVGTPASGWPVYAPAEPTWARDVDPDRILFVTDTAGLDEGHLQYSGRRQDRYGGQVGVRASTASGDGWVKANAVSVALTERVDTRLVVLDGTPYVVHSVNADGPLDAGPEAGSERSLYTVNYTALIDRHDPHEIVTIGYVTPYVVVTTEAPHGLSPGAGVSIEGNSNVGYNSSWTVFTTPSPTTFTLDEGNSGPGTGGRWA
jgi:hypothetical protein